VHVARVLLIQLHRSQERIPWDYVIIGNRTDVGIRALKLRGVGDEE